MSDDWKGKALISAKSTDAEKRSEASRMGVVIGKLRGTWTVPLSVRKKHGAFVKAALHKK